MNADDTPSRRREQRDEDDDAALLRELLLLSESPRADARAVPLTTTAAVPGASPHRSSPKKRKRPRRIDAAKVELERLRRVCAELSDVVALHVQRQQNRRNLETSASASPAERGALAVWKSVAARQFALLRDSQRQNEQLRAQVERQRTIAAGLVRLVERAHRGRPCDAIPRAPVHFDVARLTRRREELLLAVSGVVQSLQSAHYDSHVPHTVDGEYRETQSWISRENPDIAPGAVLAQSHAKRLVCSEPSRLFDQLWAHGWSSATSSTRLEIKHVEQSSNSYFVAFSTTLPTPVGQALFHSMGVRARFHSGSQDMIVAAGSLWPDATAPEPFQHSGFDVIAWTLVQPRAGSPTVNEVLVNIECSRIKAPNDSPSLTREQAGHLQSIAVGAHKFLLDCNDRCLDAYMLGRPAIEASGEDLDVV